MPLKRIETARGHKYELDGEDCPGVTTLIGGGVPKPALTLWASGLVTRYVKSMPDYEFYALRSGDERIEKKLRLLPRTEVNKAAAKGTEIHGYAEKLIKGWDVDVPLHLEGFVSAAVDFMNTWRPAPVLVEAVVGSRKHHYCGTVDLICDLPDGRRVLMDYKTSKSGIYPETAMQLAAYRNAEFVNHPYRGSDEMPMSALGITAAYAIWIRDGAYDVIPLNTGPEVFDAFLAAAHTTRAAKVSKSWVGKPEIWKAPAA